MIAFLLFIIVSIMSFIVFRYRRRRLYKAADQFPKPEKELPVIGMAHTISGSMEDVMVAIQDRSYEALKNEGILRIWLGPALYFFSTDPLDMEVILKKCLEKDYIYRFIGKVLGDGLLTGPVPIWRRRRKIVRHSFNSKIVDNLFGIIAQKSEIFANLLSNCTSVGQFSIFSKIMSCTLDTVLESLGEKSTNTQEDLDAPLLKAYHRLQELISERITYIWLQPDWLYQLLPKSSEFNKHNKVIREYGDDIIRTHKAEIKSAPDPSDIHGPKEMKFIDLMVSKSITGGEEGLTDMELKEEITTLAVAGSDTTAVSVGFILKLLGQYPEVQDKVYQELCDVLGDSDRMLENDDVRQLKYLDRVVKESLRLFPSVPIVIRKVTVDTELPSGRVLPAGSSVIVSIWGAHRDPKYWGPDAEYFDPDRFLPERLNLAHACNYMPFSFGPRNCVGLQYALLANKVMLTAVLRKYKIVGEKATSPAPQMRVKFDIVMKAADDFQIELERRK